MSESTDLKRRVRQLEAALRLHGAHRTGCPFTPLEGNRWGGCTCDTLAALRPRFLDKVVVKGEK